MSEFSYISKKIISAPFLKTPCKHLEIDNLLTKEHLDIILNDEQIHFKETTDTKHLLDRLNELKYTVQKFPGCISDPNEYLKLLDSGKLGNIKYDTPVESYGITYRLDKYRNNFIKDLISYMNGAEFKESLEDKFKITRKNDIISAIQKNLTRYEISPHPDIKEKCLTYLLNINKDDSVENYNVHTYLLSFKDNYKHIPKLWENKTDTDRCWVPWSWCDKVKTISKNNTLVMFQPSNDTLHAIKLDYNHNKFQRTQIYGNLMYSNPKTFKKITYRDL
tara:strand:- start:2527 stop:3357 length:831 start_codon:yes stop_codon:yes gene_type:complete